MNSRHPQNHTPTTKPVRLTLHPLKSMKCPHMSRNDTSSRIFATNLTTRSRQHHGFKGTPQRIMTNVGKHIQYFQTYQHATFAWISCGRPSQTTKAKRHSNQSNAKKHTYSGHPTTDRDWQSNNIAPKDMYRLGLGLLGASPPALRRGLLAATPA